MSSLGNKLRDARIEKGYTLNTLQQMTKIQKKYLVSIEEGKFNELPGVFYVRAFVKQYADVVGLNGDELLADYAEEIEVTNAEKEVSIVIENIETEEVGSRVKARQENIEKDSTEILLSYLPLAFLVGIILMIIFSLVMAISRMNSRNSENDIPQITSTAIVSTVSPESASSAVENEITQSETTVGEQALGENQIRVGNKRLTLVSSEGEETVYEVESNDFSGYTFGVKGAAYVWIGMYEDDLMVVDTTVSADEEFEYTVKNGVTHFRIRLGYPDGGTFMVNGTEIELNNAYFQDTVVFRIKEEAQDEESENQEIEETTVSISNETTEYEGPAVYRNRNGRD